MTNPDASEADVAQTSRPCDTCGTAVPRTKSTGPIPPYCSDACKPRCGIADCERPALSRGWCVFHYSRWHQAGDPEAPLVRQPNVGECTVDGCDQPSRKRGWCASHYAQWQRTGSDPVPFVWKWGEGRSIPSEPRERPVIVRVPCLVCGRLNVDSLHYQFCSGACRYLWRKYDGNPPVSTKCVACGCSIDLTERVGRQRHRRNPLTKFCRPCKRDYNKYKMSARELAVRDGADCGICGRLVDMELRRSDPGGLMCASVDHILPRSLGGTHEPDNLQLAHLYCNMVKSDRVDGGVPA